MYVVLLESCHWIVFVELCLNGMVFKMTDLLRRMLRRLRGSEIAHRLSLQDTS